MWVKICGITNGRDAAAAAAAGADAIGLNFVGGPRQLDLPAAHEILQALPSTVTPVALVRLADGQIPLDLSEFLATNQVSHVQLYGALNCKTMADIAQSRFRFMPVVAVKDSDFVTEFVSWGGETNVQPEAVVLDAYDPGREGGTGRTFRWEWVVQARAVAGPNWPAIILAGGLTPANVGDAVRIVRPYGVDVSSGVEVAGSPGKKDHEKLFVFVRNARQAAGSHLG